MSARGPVTAGREVEVALSRRHGLVAGMDEVGRGALAGPVAVGVAVVDAGCGRPPEGLTDSKALSPVRRRGLCGPIGEWVLDSAVGWATADEVDEVGIIGALRRAGRRALAEVAGRDVHPGVVLLDGCHDWLTPPVPDLFGGGGVDGGGPAGGAGPWTDGGIPVVTRVRADATCAVVSAASVIAKVARDAWMEQVEDPGYDWVHNKGYAAPAHVAALCRMGPCALHRRSWHLPGVTEDLIRSGAPAEGMMGS